MKLFVFVLLLRVLLVVEADSIVPSSFALRWSPEHVTSCVDSVTKKQYEMCFGGKLFELDGTLYGRKFGRSTLFCNPVGAIYLQCIQYFKTYYGTFVMEVTFQSSCGSEPLLLSVDFGAAMPDDDSYWTVIDSRFLYGTEIFDGVLKGTIKFGTGMVLSNDWRIGRDVYFGVLLDIKDFGIQHCDGFCGKKSDYGCWCDEGCSYFGDCCYDACSTCYLSCEEKPGCRNSCSNVDNNLDAQCATLGFKSFEIGDVCHTRQDCGIKCDGAETMYNGGKRQCTSKGFICIDEGGCFCGGVPICFAASTIAKVQTAEGIKEIRFDQLQVGDKVLSANSKGDPVYKEMYFEPYGFPTTRSEEFGTFLRISYDGGFVDISHIHTIYVLSDGQVAVRDQCISVDGKQVCAQLVNLVKVGDVLMVIDDQQGFQLIPKPVKEISYVVDQIRSPKVMNGNIIANSVLCGTHNDHLRTDFAMFSVLRLIYTIDPSLLKTQLFNELWEGWQMRKVMRKLALEYQLVAEYGAFAVYVLYSLMVGLILKAIMSAVKRLKISSKIP